MKEQRVKWSAKAISNSGDQEKTSTRLINDTNKWRLTVKGCSFHGWIPSTLGNRRLSGDVGMALLLTEEHTINGTVARGSGELMVRLVDSAPPKTNF